MLLVVTLSNTKFRSPKVFVTLTEVRVQDPFNTVKDEVINSGPKQSVRFWRIVIVPTPEPVKVISPEELSMVKILEKPGARKLNVPELIVVTLLIIENGGSPYRTV